MRSGMRENNLEFLKRLTKGIAAVLGSRCEIVIHDFSRMEESVVHIEGNVTNRQVGAPITDLVFNLLHEYGKDVQDKLGYKNTTEDGKTLRCSTMFVRDENGDPEGCMCINFDVSDFAFLSTAFTEFTFLSGPNPSEANGKERYAKNFSETMESVIDNMIAKQGKVPSMMDKEEKKMIVRKLDQSGLFMVKGAVSYLAKVFGASRYTVYNYLKEVRGG